MGIPLDIYSLYRLQGEGTACEHFLLVKVERPEFRNAIEPEYEAAIEIADRKRSHLLTHYQAHLCPHPHQVALLGELQSFPVGEALLEDKGGFEVDLWVAETRYGHPWVVMGTAADEARFWAAIAQDEDLVGLGAIGPAVRRRVWFMTERDGAQGDLAK